MNDLFFSSPVELDPGVQAKALCWSPAKGKPLLAIATGAVGVLLVNEEGRDFLNRGGRPSALNKRRVHAGRNLSGRWSESGEDSSAG